MLVFLILDMARYYWQQQTMVQCVRNGLRHSVVLSSAGKGPNAKRTEFLQHAIAYSANLPPHEIAGQYVPIANVSTSATSQDAGVDAVYADPANFGIDGEEVTVTMRTPFWFTTPFLSNMSSTNLYFIEITIHSVNEP